jgi:hypothetical protein
MFCVVKLSQFAAVESRLFCLSSSRRQRAAWYFSWPSKPRKFCRPEELQAMEECPQRSHGITTVKKNICGILLNDKD